MLELISLKRQVFLAPVLALAIALSSGGSSSKAQLGAKISLLGAGASFPAPLYERWFADYNKLNPNVQIRYQSVGSGAGVDRFVEGTVDFGASDVAMKDEEIARVGNGVVLLPVTAGSIVLAYNLPEISELKLSRQVYVDILLGKITKWNDPAIAKDNPTQKLPDQKIIVVHRSDSSGTTGVFTKHLSAISEEWKNKVGEGKTVEWPTGLGGKGNEGVSAQILQTKGSIGYLEYGYAKEHNISFAQLENKAGKFVSTNTQTASEALKAVKLPENLRAFIADPDGANSYPIVSYTWLLLYKNYDNPDKVKALKALISWSLDNGQSTAAELGYVPLPDTVIQNVKKALATVE